MKKYLPIPARFTEDSYQYIKEQGIITDMVREINIIDIVDSGKMGGILCAVKGDGKQVLVISLTHLIIKPEHPLSDKIATYQKKRIRRLQRYE